MEHQKYNDTKNLKFLVPESVKKVTTIIGLTIERFLILKEYYLTRKDLSIVNPNMVVTFLQKTYPV